MKAAFVKIGFASFVFTAAILASPIAQAQDDCAQKVAAKQATLDDVQKNYSAGKATAVDVIDAKLDLADTTYSCAPYNKYNYCKFKQNLLQKKIDLITQAGANTGAIDAVKKTLADTRVFCLDPAQ